MIRLIGAASSLSETHEMLWKCRKCSRWPRLRLVRRDVVAVLSLELAGERCVEGGLSHSKSVSGTPLDRAELTLA